MILSVLDITAEYSGNVEAASTAEYSGNLEAASTADYSGNLEAASTADYSGNLEAASTARSILATAEFFLSFWCIYS